MLEGIGCIVNTSIGTHINVQDTQQHTASVCMAKASTTHMPAPGVPCLEVLGNLKGFAKQYPVTIPLPLVPLQWPLVVPIGGNHRVRVWWKLSLFFFSRHLRTVAKKNANAQGVGGASRRPPLVQSNPVFRESIHLEALD